MLILEGWAAMFGYWLRDHGWQVGQEIDLSPLNYFDKQVTRMLGPFLLFAKDVRQQAPSDRLRE